MSTFGIKVGTYAFGTNSFVDALKIASGRRMEQYPIIRTDMTIIPENKAQPIKIDISGTVTGSDYTSLRTAIKQLKQAVDGATKDFYIDDERFIRVISRSFDYAYMTQDFANYNVGLLGEMPYLLAGTVSSYVSLPTTAVTYPVGNGGDVKVPLKISILAPNGGIPIGTTIQFENVTTGLICQFIGALTATQTLVIDCGYDDYNRPTFKVEVNGVSAMSAFEGDFISVLQGTNWLKFTGCSVATVSLYWRRGYVS